MQVQEPYLYQNNMGITLRGALKKDDNDYPVMGGTSSLDNNTIINSSFDPLTRRLLTDDSGGSGGFTVLTATETPNGIRTVFTFPSATAQPTFIVSDNAMTRATTAAGTVNWTWSSGTLQATMTIPPIDDIVAIV